MHNDIEKIEISLLALGSARPSGPSLNLSGHVRNDIYQISHQSGMTHISFMHNDIYNEISLCIRYSSIYEIKSIHFPYWVGGCLI